VVQIHYSTRFRDTFCRQSLENVEPLYRALKTFSALIYDPRNLVEMQLKTGTDSRCLRFPGPGRGFFLCPNAEEKWTTGSAASDRKQRHHSSQWLGGLARRYCETRPEKPKSGARKAESVDGDCGSKPPSPAAGCDVWGALLARPVGSGAKLRKMWFWYISGLEKIKSQHFAVGWPFSAFGFVQKNFMSQSFGVRIPL